MDTIKVDREGGQRKRSFNPIAKQLSEPKFGKNLQKKFQLVMSNALTMSTFRDKLPC